MAKKVNCSELSAAIAKLALHIGARPEIRNLDGVVTEMQKHFGEGMTRTEVVNAIVEATTGHERALSETQRRLSDLKREARTDKALREKVSTLEQHLKAGTLPETAADGPDRSSEVVKSLREVRDHLKKELAGSTPAQRERLTKQIEDLTEQLENPAAPLVKTLPESKGPEIDRLIYERDRLKTQLRRTINDLRPRTFWQKAGGAATEPFNAARALMTSLDFSAVLRQGGFITLGHPVRAAKSLVPMFKAFASPAYAHRAMREIQERPNAPMYARAKLYLAEETGLNRQEEQFMSRLAEKIPGIAGSQRAYNTFLNKLRADSFDAMAETLSRNGDVTTEEATAIANFINTATGRSSLGKWEQAAPQINQVFFAPRYLKSRFELVTLHPVFRSGNTAATRKLIATEYARYLSGLGVMFGLGILAGGEVEVDPRSSDFGKIRFGRTRIDPLSGLAQVITFSARELSGTTKRMDGKVVPIRGEKVPFGGRDGLKVALDFGRSKLSPAAGTAANIVAGKDYIGQPVTIAGEAKRLLLPMTLEDTKDAFEEHGFAGGTALGLANMFGMSGKVYGDLPEKGGR